MSADPPMLEPKAAERLTGDEELRPSGLRLLDFWRWAFSDLRANIVRGVLAEYLVGQALRDPSAVRGAWGNYDIDSDSGIRVEVKSSAYLQSWRQRALSKIIFGGLTARGWDDLTGEYTVEREVRADVYVFAIQIAESPDQYDMLDVDQWTFHVVPAQVIREHGSRSVGMSFLQRYAPEPVHWGGLAPAVEQAYEDEQAMRGSS